MKKLNMPLSKRILGAITILVAAPMMCALLIILTLVFCFVAPFLALGSLLDVIDVMDIKNEGGNNIADGGIES